MDLLLPMESTSVTMSGSKPAGDGRHPNPWRWHQGGPSQESCRATKLTQWDAGDAWEVPGHLPPFLASPRRLKTCAGLGSLRNNIRDEAATAGTPDWGAKAVLSHGGTKGAGHGTCFLPSLRDMPSIIHPPSWTAQREFSLQAAACTPTLLAAPSPGKSGRDMGRDLFTQQLKQPRAPAPTPTCALPLLHRENQK